MTEEQSKGASMVMKTLFSVDTYHPWLVDLPDTSIKVPLTQLHGFGKNGIASGKYEDGPERGSVSMVYPEIFALKLGDPAQEMYFTAPYFVSNQGSGVFWYLGLFRYDNRFKSVSQIDWIYLGDRITWHAILSDKLGTNWLRLQFHGLTMPITKRLQKIPANELPEP